MNNFTSPIPRTLLATMLAAVCGTSFAKAPVYEFRVPFIASTAAAPAPAPTPTPDPEPPVPDVPLPAAKFVLSMTSLSFPNVTEGQTANLSFIIDNDGDASDTPKVTAQGPFTASTCGSVEPGGSCSVQVSFNPTSGQQFTGRVDVEHLNATQSVQLSGKGNTGYFTGFVPTGLGAYSPSGNFALVIQTDCNLVLYRTPISPAFNSTWHSATYAQGDQNCGLLVGTDGRLSVETPNGKVLWISATPTPGYSGPTWMAVGDDGAIRVYAGTYPKQGRLLFSGP